MKEPVDHILRPQLPWRATAAITECGLNATSVKTLSRPEYFARLSDMGRQRSALVTCMTCANTAGRWKTWDEDPLQAIQREIEWERGYFRRTERGHAMLDELQSIAALIDAHPDEFAALKNATTQRREWVEKKERHKIDDRRRLSLL